MSEERTYNIGAHSFVAPMLPCALYLVSTPIGNLKDITLRALETLASVSYIACEDTRVSRNLLTYYGIKGHLFSYHEHNSERSGKQIISYLKSGASVALISDAGTPLICDPGFKLVEKVLYEKIQVCAIPGACALLAGLITSGLPTDKFYFMGFLPAKRASRQEKIRQLIGQEAVCIFYETASRLLESLEDMIAIIGPDRRAAICRELTKKFETVTTETLSTLYRLYKEELVLKGEIVLIIAPDKDFSLSVDVDALLLDYAQKMPPAQAARYVAQQTGLKKQPLYQRLLDLHNGINKT